MFGGEGGEASPARAAPAFFLLFVAFFCAIHASARLELREAASGRKAAVLLWRSATAIRLDAIMEPQPHRCDFSFELAFDVMEQRHIT